MPVIVAMCQPDCPKPGRVVKPTRSARPCVLCENAARFNDNASEMFGFGYSLFHQWPRFRLWAQQSDPCQHCRDRGRILQIMPALAGQTRCGCGLEKQDAIAGRAAQDRQGGGSTRRRGTGGCRSQAGWQGCQYACCSPACSQWRLQRQGRICGAPGRAERPLPVAAGQGQTASRLSPLGGCAGPFAGKPAKRPARAIKASQDHIDPTPPSDHPVQRRALA